MQVGMATICQNPDQKISDYEVYKNEIRLADLAEPLGFDSIWSVEHHFTDYTKVPDVLQFLTYMAGRTKNIKLGSMVVVLPWHDPMRVAEQIAMLDDLCDGRLILGSESMVRILHIDQGRCGVILDIVEVGTLWEIFSISLEDDL